MPTVQTSSGLSFFYREHGSGDRVMLFIHGNLASSLWWERVFEHLPPGVRAIAPDLRGCGGSAKPAPPWSIADLAEDVAQVAQALGVQRCDVVAHSLGGSVALQLAIAHPDLVRSLVVINSAPADGLALPDAAYEQIKVLAGMPEVIKGALAAMMPTAPKDAYHAQLLEDSVTNSVGAWLPNGYALRDFNAVESAAALKVPMLVVYGKQDNLVTLAMSERLRDQVPGATLEVWEEIGHSALVEAAQRLVQRIIDFIK